MEESSFVTGVTVNRDVQGLCKFNMLWNTSLDSWKGQTQVRSQLENKTCLLSSKDMLTGREETDKRTGRYETENDKKKRTSVCLPLKTEKVCFKVKISSHGKWNSNDCGNYQIAGTILKGKCRSLRSLISPEWNHTKCLMISFIYSNEALGAFLMERCHH